jgi:biotin carboxyl carrier protein
MGEVKAPMGGKVIEVKVKVGDTVNAGDEIVVIEAMKMELPVISEESGAVKEIKCDKGDTVDADALLVTLE